MIWSTTWCERVTTGEALSAAWAEHPEAFTTMQVSMVRAGETAGALETVMVSLAGFAERDLELREKLRSAAIYPLMVVGLGAVSILVIMLFILPRIMSVVSETGGALPLPTRILMGLTEGLRSPMGIAAGLGLAVAFGLWWRWKRTPAGRLAMDELLLRLPLVGPALRRVAVSRFARTLGTLAAANIPIVEVDAHRPRYPGQRSPGPRHRHRHRRHRAAARRSPTNCVRPGDSPRC